eukprot:TRINITY_DN7946_c0_g1_i10.p1 TRINITY_DN7946_c0_g1~~TRINITY_DN7946_c0_g1_i10.p1  ORF type:complete len:473 (-),score=52.40 TRINITY_DN7946_c0_g1_i10:1558-2847(-)
MATNISISDLPDDLDELKKLTLEKMKEIQTHKKSLQNLAITVVRQDKHIKALVQHINAVAGLNGKQQQQESNLSGGNSNSYEDTIGEDWEIEEETDQLADFLKEHIDNANDYLNQLEGDVSLPYQAPQRSGSPYRQNQQQLQVVQQQQRGLNQSRCSTPQSSQQSYNSQGGNVRAMNRPPRPVHSSSTLSTPLSARREQQRESVLSNMNRVPPMNGRSETPTRQGALYNRSGTYRRPASVVNLRSEEEDHFASDIRRPEVYGGVERYSVDYERERIPMRSMTPTEGRSQYQRPQYIRREGSYLRTRSDEQGGGEGQVFGGSTQLESTPRGLNRRYQSTLLDRERDVRSVDSLRRSAGSAMSFRTSDRLQSKRESFRFNRDLMESEFDTSLALDEMDGGHVEDDDVPTQIPTPRLARFATQQRYIARDYQ